MRPVGSALGRTRIQVVLRMRTAETHRASDPGGVPRRSAGQGDPDRATVVLSWVDEVVGADGEVVYVGVT
jgi:hypothetical protein